MKIARQILLDVLGLAVMAQSILAVELPAPMPEFMKQDQLFKWREDRKVVALDSETATETTQSHFYTGKPYDKDQEAYLFKYRSYDPELSRWTSQDPSGFPDGVNNNLYTPNPLSNLDPNGLIPLPVSKDDYFNPNVTANNFAAAGAKAIQALTAIVPAPLAVSQWNMFLSLVSVTMNTMIPSIPTGHFQAQITATGYYDASTQTWSNPGAVTHPGSYASVGFSGALGGSMLANGAVSYLLSYTLSGAPSFTSTSSNPTHVIGLYVPHIVIEVSGSVTLGAGFTFGTRGSVNAAAQSYSVRLHE